MTSFKKDIFAYIPAKKDSETQTIWPADKDEFDPEPDTIPEHEMAYMRLLERIFDERLNYNRNIS